MATNDTQAKSITPEQRRALDALLGGADNAGAAKAAGCSERTLLRWKTEPVFRQALQNSQDAMLDAVTGALVSASMASVSLLRNVVEDDDAQLSHRLRAAGQLLDSVLRWTELRSLAQRISALEAAAAPGQRFVVYQESLEEGERGMFRRGAGWRGSDDLPPLLTREQVAADADGATAILIVYESRDVEVPFDGCAIYLPDNGRGDLGA